MKYLKNINTNTTGSGYDCHGGLGGWLEVTNNSQVSLDNNTVTSNYVSPASANGNSFGGLIGYIKADTASFTATNNKINSTLNLARNGSFSGGFIGTLTCTSCQINLTKNTTEINYQLPLTFNGGFFGGFISLYGPTSGSTVNISKNSVIGSVTIPSTTANRARIGGFIGSIAIPTGVTSLIKDNYNQVNLTIQSTGSSAVSGFIGYLGITGSGIFNFERNYSIGDHTITSAGANHGGIFGQLSGTVNYNTYNSYYSSDDYAAGIGNTTNAEVIGLTRTQMLAGNYFIGWDFVNTWSIVSSYPILR